MIRSTPNENCLIDVKGGPTNLQPLYNGRLPGIGAFAWRGR